jgi:protease-4
MGSVAASGGYWLATAADEIWATPTTITGSIGVFGAFPTIEKTLEKMGIHTDGLGTTELAGSMRLDRDLPPIANSVIQQGVEFTYRAFLQRVADAREQTPEAIHEVAQGQVWSGTQAKALGLVDELGSLDDVIASAAKFAELSQYSVEIIERELTPQEALLKQLTGGTAAFMPSSLLESFAPVALRQALAPLIKPFIRMSSMTDPKGIYVQCENCLAP